MGLYWVINMGVPVLIGVCQQASSGGGGGAITFSINQVGGQNAQPSPQGISTSFATTANSFKNCGDTLDNAFIINLIAASFTLTAIA